MSGVDVASADDLMSWAASVPAAEGLLTPFGFVDVAALSETGRVDALVALQRLGSWVQAQQARVFAACAAAEDEMQWVREELRAALRLSRVAVDERMHAGRELVGRLPATLALLESGAITGRHASAVVDAVTPLDDAAAARVEARVLERAGQQTPAGFRRSVRRAVLAVDPRDAETKHRAAKQDRRICATEVGDGMSEIWGLMPTEDAATLMTALHAMAAGTVAGDDRTADQRRVDALVSLAAQRLPEPGLPQWQGRRPSVQLVVTASTLLGLDDEPGVVDGFGPVPASVARQIAADPTGTWQRVLTDPAGRLVDCSRRYKPAAALAEFVIARDRTCRFPGCGQPARRTELDHQHPWEHGGLTVADNLQCLCRRHHHLKHEAGWTVTGDPAGELVWTSPTGHVYRSPPGRLRLVREDHDSRRTRRAHAISGACRGSRRIVPAR